MDNEMYIICQACSHGKDDKIDLNKTEDLSRAEQMKNADCPQCGVYAWLEVPGDQIEKYRARLQIEKDVCGKCPELGDPFEYCPGIHKCNHFEGRA